MIGKAHKARNDTPYYEPVSWPRGGSANHMFSSRRHRLMMSLVRLMSSLVIASLFAWTVLGQKKYQLPPVKTSDQFRGAEVRSPVDTCSIGDLKWFEVFQDEALQKLVRT